MPSRPRDLEGFLRTVAPYAVPAALLGWAFAVSWETPQAGAKIVVSAAMAALLTQGARWPLLCLASSFAALFGVGSLDPPLPEDALLGMVVCASYLVGRHARFLPQPWAAAAVLLLLASNLVEHGRDVVAADVVFPVLLTAAPWLLGLSVQLAVRREQAAVQLAGELDRGRAEEVHRATTEERLRIAREFHDVVAHDISGLSLQAQVLRRSAASGNTVSAEQLRELEQAAQRAMTDVRRLLGVLRPAGEAPPLVPGDGLDRVPALVEGARRQGQEIRLVVTGDTSELPPALSAAAFRIVQEALTNARRHGAPGAAHVTLDRAEGALTIRITNPLRPGHPQRGDGHGVAGIHERTRLFGGRASVGIVGDEWRVEVHMPTPASVTEVSS